MHRTQHPATAIGFGFSGQFRQSDACHRADFVFAVHKQRELANVTWYSHLRTSQRCKSGVEILIREGLVQRQVFHRRH